MVKLQNMRNTINQKETKVIPDFIKSVPTQVDKNIYNNQNSVKSLSDGFSFEAVNSNLDNNNDFIVRAK